MVFAPRHSATSVEEQVCIGPLQAPMEQLYIDPLLVTAHSKNAHCPTDYERTIILRSNVLATNECDHTEERDRID